MPRKNYKDTLLDLADSDIENLRVANGKLQAKLKVVEKALGIAAQEAYHSEVIDTDMEDITIGEDGDYTSREEWIEDRVDSWMSESKKDIEATDWMNLDSNDWRKWWYALREAATFWTLHIGGDAPEGEQQHLDMILNLLNTKEVDDRGILIERDETDG